MPEPLVLHFFTAHVASAEERGRKGKAVNRPGEAVARNAFHAPGAFADDAGEDAQGGRGGERARGAELVGAAAAFCFPEACEVERLPVSKSGAFYTFCLTGADGSRTTGFVRRVAAPPALTGPDGLPVALCVLSRRPWQGAL